VGLVGSEGMSPWRALVQGSGGAIRIDAARFRGELAHGAALRHGLNRYVYVAIAQLSPRVACTQFHVSEARLAPV
jgi:hypothetical protein